MPEEKHAGAVISEQREAKGWTVYKLAKESGVDPSALYRIEDGRQSTSLDVAISLCSALGCSLAVFDRLKNSGEKS
jgi:transcriptional regulator with XRE-family HTH domain